MGLAGHLLCAVRQKRLLNFLTQEEKLGCFIRIILLHDLQRMQYAMCFYWDVTLKEELQLQLQKF